MFLQWGDGQDSVWAGDMGVVACPRCAEDTPASLFVRYHYGYVYFIFSCVMRFEYFLTCDKCGYSTKLDPAAAKPHVQCLHIPFMTRYGCLMGILLVAILMGLFIWRLQ